MRVSPRFFIEGIMTDCVLSSTEMELEVADDPSTHFELMQLAQYEL